MGMKSLRTTHLDLNISQVGIYLTIDNAKNNNNNNFTSDILSF